MLVGTPVFASRVGGLQEIVQDGVTGRLIPVDQPGEIVKIIRSVSRDILKRYGQNGRKRLLEKYTSTEMNQKTLDLYLELDTERRGGGRLRHERVSDVADSGDVLAITSPQQAACFTVTSH
jgi:hypothetical protein